MPRFDYKCLNGHVVESEFPFGQAPDDMLCQARGEIIGRRGWICSALAVRQIATGMKFIINKVMLPPSKRVKNYTLAKPSKG